MYERQRGVCLMLGLSVGHPVFSGRMQWKSATRYNARTLIPSTFARMMPAWIMYFMKFSKGRKTKPCSLAAAMGRSVGIIPWLRYPAGSDPHGIADSFGYSSMLGWDWFPKSRPQQWSISPPPSLPWWELLLTHTWAMRSLPIYNAPSGPCFFDQTLVYPVQGCLLRLQENLRTMQKIGKIRLFLGWFH